MKKKIVRLGLYGCGNRTRALLDSLYGEDEYQVVAAYDICRESVESLCRKYGGKVCSNADELVSYKEADAFMISLDPFAHYDAFNRTAAAGKPIFIEKPLALTAQKSYEMMKTAQEKKVPVHVGLMRRYLPKHVTARRFLAENDLGHFFSVTCRWFHAGETEMINCMNNCPDNFRLKVSQIPFHCCHALDVMRLYGGEVKKVDARGLKLVKRNYPSPDEVIALFEFENGAIGQFHYCSMAYQGEISYLIHTENYTLNFTDGLEIWYRPRHKSQREDGSGDCRPVYHRNVGPDRYMLGAHPSTTPAIMLDFLNSVRNGTPMKVPIEDAYKVAEIAEAIEMSYTSGKEVSLPLEFSSENA